MPFVQKGICQIENAKTQKYVRNNFGDIKQKKTNKTEYQGKDGGEVIDLYY